MAWPPVTGLLLRSRNLSQAFLFRYTNSVHRRYAECVELFSILIAHWLHRLLFTRDNCWHLLATKTPTGATPINDPLANHR